MKNIVHKHYSVRGFANWVLDLSLSLQIPVTNMALNKIVFFAVEKMLLERGELLTDAKIEAWDHGPVFRELYQAFKKHGDKPITSRAEFYSVNSGSVEIVSLDINEDDSLFLESIVRPLLPLSASKLREISHSNAGAWHKVWWYDGHSNPGMEIAPDVILEAAELRGRFDA